VNVYKHIVCVAALFALMPAHGAISCAAATTTLRVGILDDNLPYSSVVNGIAIGFDPLLVTEIAKYLGYSTVEFIIYPNILDATAAVQGGQIDVFAFSDTALTPSNVMASDVFGIITDISQIYTNDFAGGYLISNQCCTLALGFEQAINTLVANGVYAQLLQAVRLAGHTEGLLLGLPRSSGVAGTLLEPIPFFSSEFGTITASGCSASGPSYQQPVLPTLSPISAYLLNNFTPTITGPSGITGVAG